MFQHCGKANFSSSSSVNGALGGEDPGIGATSPDGSASLTVRINPLSPPKGTVAVGNVTMVGFGSATYACVTRAAGTSVASGTVGGAQTSFNVTVNEDLNCVVTAVGVSPSLQVTHPIDVDCGNQIKSGGACRDFSCASVVQLSTAQLQTVPARGADGVCYSYKLMSEIPLGASAASGAHDSSVLATSHDVVGTNANPWVMSVAEGVFRLLGPRVVKLAGSGTDPTKAILVNNFVLTGVFPSGTTPNPATQYQARGTADAAVLVNGASSGLIYLNGTPLKLTPFGSSGTGSVTPIDLTAFAAPNVLQAFDVRALDCGASRQLSDVYLLFQ